MVRDPAREPKREPARGRVRAPVSDLVIDCDRCAVRGLACTDCVVTVLLGTPAEGAELDETERRAIAALAEGGLIPPLRLVSGPDDTVSRRTHVA